MGGPPKMEAELVHQALACTLRRLGANGDGQVFFLVIFGLQAGQNAGIEQGGFAVEAGEFFEKNKRGELLGLRLATKKQHALLRPVNTLDTCLPVGFAPLQECLPILAGFQMQKKPIWISSKKLLHFVSVFLKYYSEFSHDYHYASYFKKIIHWHH
jgi:hypothetical protein